MKPDFKPESARESKQTNAEHINAAAAVGTSRRKLHGRNHTLIMSAYRKQQIKVKV